jgi:hypothetical protein
LALALVHERVMEHYSDRSACADGRSYRRPRFVEADAHAFAPGEPVNCDGQLEKSVEVEWRGGRVARKDAESCLKQTLARNGRAAIPGRRKSRAQARAEQFKEPSLPRFNIALLERVVSGDTEFTLASLRRFVIQMGETVLMYRHPFGFGLDTSAEFRNQLWGERCGYRRDIQRHRVAREKIKQFKQPIIAPTGVIIAEEESDRMGRGV